MEKIKSFFYLDNEKLKSLSSQIFKGVTEGFIQSNLKSTTETEEQKGKFFSGKELYDSVILESYKGENKFLHDYLYNMFEDKLLKDERVKIIDSSNSDSLNVLDFVKVKGQAIIRDSKSIMKLLNEFNTIGEAIAYTSNVNNLQMPLNREERRRFNEKTMINNYINDNHLKLPENFVKSIKQLLEFGLGDDLLEIQINTNNVTYSSILNREHLKENVISFIKKFSRCTEANIIIFGYVTQLFNEKVDFIPKMQEVTSNTTVNMKQTYNEFIVHLMQIEKAFSTFDEIIIDPIAIYVEL